MISYLFIILRAKNSTEHQRTILGLVFLYEITDFCTKNSEFFCHNSRPSITNCGEVLKIVPKTVTLTVLDMYPESVGDISIDPLYTNSIFKMIINHFVIHYKNNEKKNIR